MHSTLVVLDVSGNELFRLTDLAGYYVHSLFLSDMNRDGKKDMVFASDEGVPSGITNHSTVYAYYNNFPSVAVQQAGSEKIAREYFDLAEEFLASGQYEKAREYYIKARDAYAGLGNSEMVRRCNTRIEEIATMQAATPAPKEKPEESGTGVLIFLIALGGVARILQTSKK